MEELHPTPVPEEVPAVPAPDPTPAAPERDCWADLAPGALDGDDQALLAAWMAGRAMPRRKRVRQAIGAAALAGLLFCLVWGCWLVLDDQSASPLLLVCPLVLWLLFLLAVKDLPHRFVLRRALRRVEDATLYPDRLHLVTPDGEEDLAVEDLIMVQRYHGWTVLIWGSWQHPRIFPVPDDACFGDGPFLYDRLRERVSDAPFFRTNRPPRRRRHPVAMLLVTFVWLLAEVFLLATTLGIHYYTSKSPTGSGTVRVTYREKEGTLASEETGTFTDQATGEFRFRWEGDNCCVVTYRCTDGALRVQLLEPAPGAARRFSADPPQGSWTAFASYDDTTTLRWDPDLPGYRLKTTQGEFVCRQWQDFDGMGLALCDDRGLPRWTVIPTTLTPQEGTGQQDPVEGLSLCPVDITAGTFNALPLRPADSDSLTDGQTADGTAAVNPAAPQFGDTLDVCVNGDGVFFTWDGGAGSSQVLTAEDCARAGIESEADLEPLVLRWDVASFLTVEDGRVYSHTTCDQGQTWQTTQLATLGSDTLTDRCYGFSGPGPGYASLSGTDADGAPWVKVFMTVDHGASWQRITTPQSADGVLRPLNGLAFYDGACGVATAPADEGEAWPHVYTTADCGVTWVEPDIPFGESRQTGATRLESLSHDGIDWHLVLTQAPEGDRLIEFEGSDLTRGLWNFVSVRTAG